MEVLRISSFPNGTEVAMPFEGDSSLMEETGWAYLFLVVLPFCSFGQALLKHFSLFPFPKVSAAPWLEDSAGPLRN